MSNNSKDTVENPQPSVSQKEPNKNGRRRWNKKPKQDRSEEPAKPVGTAYSAGQPMSRDEAATSSKFKPQHLSKNDSASKDGEILTDKSILVEGIALTARQVRTYGLDCTQFLEIVESAFKARQLSDKRFKDLIPLSVFTYYCEVLLWKRILFLLTGKPDVSETNYLNFISSLPDMSVPQEVGQYIDGIGHVKDPAGVIYHFDIEMLPVKVGKGFTAGHYGRLSKNNHYMYETVPAPLIVLERLAYDLLQFREPDRDIYWDTSVTPDPATRKYLPNANLLGWAPAVAVTQSQYSWISECVEIEASGEHVSTVFHDLVNRSNIAIVRPLLKKVSDVLAEAKYRNDVNKYRQSTVKGGSMSIMMFHDRQFAETLTGVKRRQLRRLSSLPMQGNSFHQTNINTISAATNFRYRIKRVGDLTVPDCLCYLDASNSAPPGWMDTADTVFKSVSLRSWNISEFITPYSPGNRRADDYVRRVAGIDLNTTQII